MVVVVVVVAIADRLVTLWRLFTLSTGRFNTTVKYSPCLSLSAATVRFTQCPSDEDGRHGNHNSSCDGTLFFSPFLLLSLYKSCDYFQRCFPPCHPLKTQFFLGGGGGREVRRPLRLSKLYGFKKIPGRITRVFSTPLPPLRNHPPLTFLFSDGMSPSPSLFSHGTGWTINFL